MSESSYGEQLKGNNDLMLDTWPEAGVAFVWDFTIWIFVLETNHRD